MPGATAPLSEAKAAVAKLEAPVTQLTPSGPPFNAAAAAKGKTIGWVTISSAIPFTAQMFQGVDPAAKALGLNIRVCDGKGDPSQWAACFSQFIGQKVNLIVSQSIDPRVIKASIAAAAKAHIPVVTTSSNYPGAPLWPETSAEDPQPFYQVGAALGDWMVADSDGKANALLITDTDVYTAAGQVQATINEFKKYCPQTCKWKVINVPTADWASKVPTEVTSEISSNPNLTYVSPVYDGEAPFAISAVRSKGDQKKIKVASFNALPGIVTYMRNKDVLSAGIGVWVQQHGYAAVDDIARVLAGQKNIPALRDSKLAMRMFDTNNVGTLNFKDPASWYGNASLAQFYAKQWKLN